MRFYPIPALSQEEMLRQLTTRGLDDQARGKEFSQAIKALFEITPSKFDLWLSQ